MTTSAGTGAPRDLLDFLTEAELQQYFKAFQTQLKVTNVPQLKYVEDEDLQELGMTKPEIRRLKKFFKKECPQGTFSKLKRILTTSKEAAPTSSTPAPSVVSQVPKSPSRQVIPEDALTVLKPIGSGEFGTVSQGVWTDEEGERIQVAIKCLSKSKLGGTAADFLKEAASMQAVDHEHVVRMYGVVLAHDELRLVTELAPLRSLLECLKEASLRASFPVHVLCEFSCQIASGMAHLEQKRLIHRDLSARNILVFSRDKVKISDFGLSRALGVGKDYYQTNFTANLKLPIAWCAPECINFLKFTSASDMWAYGVTLWEMFSYGFQPWAALTGEQDDVSGLRDIASRGSRSWKFAQKILEAIDEPNGQRLDQPDHCPKEHYGVMKKCWEHDPERRPTFAELQLMMPQLRPEKVQMTCDCPPSSSPKKDILPYRSHDLITVLDKRPEKAPEEGLWKGATESGKVGYVHSANTKPYIEVKTGPSPAPRRIKVNRKESGRKSSRQSKRLDITMIGVPEKDLRHMGHIGYDGAVFGDVSFIGNSYDKLPVKVASPAKHNGSASMTSSVTSIGHDDRSDVDGSDLLSLPIHSQTSTSMSGISLTSSQDDTLTDVSSMQDASSSCSIPTLNNDSTSLLANGGAADDDFFKLPDLSSDLGLDFGTSSLMDDIMKSLTLSTMTDDGDDDGDDKTTTASNSFLDADKSPLLETSSDRNGDDFLFSSSLMTTRNDDDTAAPFQNGRSSFDNFGLDTDSQERTDVEDEDERRSDSVRDSVASSLEGGVSGGGGGGVSGAGSMSDSKASISDDQGSGRDDDGGLASRRRPKLRITIPSRKELESRHDASGVKPMSASDERKLDEAIELANEFAQISTEQQRSPRSAEVDSDSNASSPRLRGMFSLKKRDKSPKQEKKTFSEGMANVSDVGEELTPEAQEAYNMLVVRGSRDSEKGKSAASRTTRTARANNNANIRAPQGIPGRSSKVSEPDSPSAADSNPLRRLRESSFIAPKPKPKPGSTNGSSKIQANLPFFDKLKEQEAMDYRGSAKSPTEEGNGTEGRSKPDPPPRNPLRLSTVNARPRERKNPLDLSNYSAKTTGRDLNTSRDSDDSAFNTESDASGSSASSLNPRRPKSNDSSMIGYFATSSLASQQQQQQPPSSTLSQQFPVKAVKLSASDLGLGDAGDAFWSESVDFEELGGGPRMLGRYRTSDTVSYEDLLEFALDGGGGGGGGKPEEQEEEQDDECFFKGVERAVEGDMSDEVRLMKKVLSRDVSTEDCMYALEETSWDVHAAIKLIKLKQLLSTDLADKSTCKNALIMNAWDVEKAADYLAPEHTARGRDSPELVHV